MFSGAEDSGQSREALPDEEDMRLPPRRILHARDTSKATRIFQASLVVMLVALTAGMVVLYRLYGES
jgi:hypothetical protein